MVKLFFVPTIGGEVYFDDPYYGEPPGQCDGSGDSQGGKLGQGGVGNPVLRVGSSTGREDIRRATFASEELDKGKRGGNHLCRWEIHFWRSTS